ncbi:integrase core domain protein-like protein, partial [Dinothrombium tinctorium]
MGIKHNCSSPFHPQGHSPVERVIRTLQDCLSKFISDNHRNWDEKLPSILFAYNTSRHQMTGVTPYFLCYGKEPRTEIEAKLSKEEITEIGDVMERIKQRIVYLKRARKADHKRKAVSFDEGDLVLLRRPIIRVGRSKKFSLRFIGPLRGPYRRYIAHVSQMKKFFTRKELNGVTAEPECPEPVRETVTGVPGPAKPRKTPNTGKKAATTALQQRNEGN